MLVAIRHGSTNFNATGGKEKMRGWLPLPLDEKGIVEASKTARYLKNLNILNGNKTLYSSDLPRAIQTAEEIASTLGMKVEPKKELRDWNVGDFAGREVDKTLNLMNNYIDNPTKKIPGGESYKDYYTRTVPFLKKLIESDDLNAVVTHNRTMTLLKALTISKGEMPNRADLKSRGPVKPCGIMIIHPDWSTVFSDVAEKDGHG
jgi:broad specificity phosphatase PhoE